MATSIRAEQLKQQYEDPNAEYVGPYAKDGNHEDEILSLLWAAGLKTTTDGQAIEDTEE